MNCSECGSKTINKTSEIKQAVGLTYSASMVEFIAVIIVCSAFVYESLNEYSGMLLMVAFVFALLGHALRYAKIIVLRCQSCNKDFPLNITSA